MSTIVITRDGAKIALVDGTTAEFAALDWFHKNVGYSMDHAIKHEGYGYREVTLEALTGNLPSLVHQARNILWSAENGGTAGRPIDVRTILAAICDESERLYGAS
jgi:hypothetical protein